YGAGHQNKLQADQRNIVWNSKRGFTIRRPDYDHIGLLYCQNNSNTTSSVRKHIMKGRTEILFYSVLTLPVLQRSDRGRYTAGSTVHPPEGQRMGLSWRPTWAEILSPGPLNSKPFLPLRLKDGMVAAERCSRYRVNESSLVIRDVAEEDAGRYTVLVRNKAYGLYRNLTLTLVVNARPQIGEKAVTSPDPAPVPRGSRKALHCTSQGVPSPRIHWQWHPCPADGLLAARRA
ncbi:hypothetical protein CRUP_011059, partial [Coryphaenoides rupestris]